MAAAFEAAYIRATVCDDACVGPSIAGPSSAWLGYTSALAYVSRLLLALVRASYTAVEAIAAGPRGPPRYAAALPVRPIAATIKAKVRPRPVRGAAS